MPDKKVTILSTRPLDESVVIAAEKQDIVIHQAAFIQTEAILNDKLHHLITDAALNPLTVVFTSMNAVEAVAGYLRDRHPVWNIYCLGTATKKLVNDRFTASTITGTADNATALAESIIGRKEKNVLFFCGDQRRKELPEKLASANILVKEVVVYTTIETARKIDACYDGILFFSPSAVESFFSVNTVSKDTVLFAIGSTTAESIKQFSSNTIIQGDLPGKDNLAEKAIAYFKTIKPVNEHVEK